MVNARRVAFPIEVPITCL